ncbi:hypothetical protein AAFX60_017280 [Aliivibrio fischeri]
MEKIIKKIESQNIKREIKEILSVLCWSVPKFTSKYIIDTSDRDVPDHEIKTCQEKIKQQLRRDTTPKEKLVPLLNFLKATEEYSKLIIDNKIPKFEPLTGLFSDYAIILREESNPINRKVLEVAAAYALAIGTAWGFNIVPIYTSDDYEKRYIVIWEGDVGHNCGSGTWGPAMCEVAESHFGSLFVDSAEHVFDTTLRCIDEVIGYSNGALILSGRRYANDDSNNYPSLKYLVKLSKNTENKWELNEEEFLSKKYL